MTTHTPLLLFHVFAATIGLLSGCLAMIFRKGSGLHGAAGSVFFVSMLSMSLSGAYISTFIRPIMLNVVVGLLTSYLVATAWWSARHREAQTGWFDRIAFLYVLSVGIAGITFGVQAVNSPTGAKNGIPSALYFVFGTIALLCALGDVRMFRRGGVSGTRRLVRHLWRMCFALLIALMSLYPGQARLFPKWLRETNLLVIPHILLIGALLFWLARMRSRRRAQQQQPAIVPAYAEAA